jgi:D-glucosaminate-6-phosphate ammonia-lyase
MLTIPCVHLQAGATLVGYSGGKCIRGPQCAGMLLGRKDLVKAAWVSSAPHHGHGRTMKLGKEEAMGMLAAVEMWVKRDHKAEMEMWHSWMKNIAGRVSSIDGVSATIREPRGLSNHTPGLSISWDAAKLGITGEEVSNILFTTEPRIALAGGGGGRMRRSGNETGIAITAYMMSPGEDKIVGDRIHEILSAPRPSKKPQPPKPAGDLTGRWDVRIEFAAGSAEHSLHVKQQGAEIVGTHQGDFISREISGTIDGDEVRIASLISEEHGAALSYHFNGQLSGDTMSGALNMGEYLTAKWTAKRHVFGGPPAMQ